VPKRVPERSPVQKQAGKSKKSFFNQYQDPIGLASILVLGIIIYSNSFHCSFHFDDIFVIINNPNIQDLSNIRAWWNDVPSRPLGGLSFALNYHFNHLDVRYYHAVNLLIHLITSCLVGWLTLLLFSAPVLKDHPVAKQKKAIALFAALLFVSHPLATQSVTYIVQRLAAMVAMFYLLSCSLYLKARLTDSAGIKRYLLFAGSFLSAVAAMLTKENAFTLPIAILLIEFFFFRTTRINVNFRDWRVILALTAILGVGIIIPFNLTAPIFDTIPPMQGHTYTVTPYNYFLTQFSVISRYIRLLFLPVNQNFDYDFPISNSFFELRTIVSFLFLFSLLILGIFLFKKQRILSFGIFWFFLTLAIESSFIPIPNVIFEHRTYLPSVGYFLILSSGVYIFLWDRNRNLVIAILMILVVSNSFLTYERNKVWKDDLSLWNDVISKPPVKARPYYNRGVAYATLGEWQKSLADNDSAIGINPAYLDAYINRGVAYGSLGQWDKAIADYSRVIDIAPAYQAAYANRGIAYGNIGQWEKSIADETKAIEYYPKNYKYFYTRALAYFNLGQMEKAVADLSKALEINPKYTDAYSTRGVAYGNLGQWTKSLADYTMALRIDAGYANAYSNRGVAYGNLGQWDKAVDDYTRAIGINPQFANAWYNRGFAYSKLGQWEKAIADYTKALEIDPGYAKAETDRNAAYKMTGRVKSN
jgi:protein O-mannosyl-transferase